MCQGAKPLRIPAERVRTYAEKWQNFTISGCSFIGEYGILGLVQQIRILKRSVMTMIFDFEPWQLDIDIDLTKQLYRSCKGDFVWVEKK